LGWRVINFFFIKCVLCCYDNVLNDYRIETVSIRVGEF
jgi:hypothetical protein